MMQAPSSQSKALPFPVTIFGSFAVLLRIVSVLFVSVALICISPVVRAEDPQPARGLGHVDIGYTAPLVHHGISLYGPDDPLPEKFDLRDISGKSYVSSVKDQGYYGTCWAFAALASAESNLLMRGYEQYTDLSELHLVNYTYHRTESLAELLGGTRGDVTTVSASIPYPNALTLGGNAMFAANTLSMRLGAADESILPYPPLDTDHSNPEPHVRKIILGTLEDDYARSNNILQFDHAYFISISEPDEIKKTLMTHGAASVSLYYDSATPDDLVYYYQNTDLVSNHDITIVGWDDTLPASSFSTEPPIDGAWICKNSWSRDWHDDGYFYVSYAKPSLGDAVFFSMNPIPESSDVLYQYDGGLFPSGSSGEPGGSLSFANVFTAGSDETLHSICLSNLVNTNTDVRIGYIPICRMHTLLPSQASCKPRPSPNKRCVTPAYTRSICKRRFSFPPEKAFLWWSH